jgi:hypothetical protein
MGGEEKGRQEREGKEKGKGKEKGRGGGRGVSPQTQKRNSAYARMHLLYITKLKFFWGGAQPPPRPHPLGASVPVPFCLRLGHCPHPYIK